MSDPARPYSQRQSDPAGVGPFQFTVPALAAGESHRINLRERENGRYVVASPAGYDSLEITNLSTDVPLTVEINDGAGSLSVPPNTTQAIAMEGIYVVEVTNEAASTSTNAGDVNVEVLAEPYGADEQAREKRSQPPINALVEHLSGLSIGRGGY